ncbi:tetratricopeptide repeat protein [Fredinandcohnia humi]
MKSKSNTKKTKKQLQNYHCLVKNQLVSEKSCITFQTGGQLSLQNPDEFTYDELPCLQCESLVRPVKEIFSIRTSLPLHTAFLWYEYNGFFVYSHKLETLAAKMKIMLSQMGFEDAFIFEAIGDKFTEYQSYVMAIDYYEKAELLKPTAQLSRKLGKVFYFAKNYEIAISQLEKAKGMYAETYLVLGHCYQELNNTEKAIANYEKANKLDPNNGEIVEAIATSYYKMVNPNECNHIVLLQDTILYYKKLVDRTWEGRKKEININNKYYLFNEKDFYVSDLANLYFLAQDYQQAIDVINTYISQFSFESEKDIRASVTSGKLLIEITADLDEKKKKVHREKTIQFFQRLFSTFYKTKAYCYYHLKNDDKAHLMVERATAFGYIHPQLADLRLKLGEREENIRLEKEIIKRIARLEEENKAIFQANNELREELNRLKAKSKDISKRVDNLGNSVNDLKVRMGNVEVTLEEFMRNMDEKVEKINQSIDGWKSYVDTRFTQYSLLTEVATKHFSDWEKRHELLRELLSPEVFESFKQFDLKSDQQIKSDFAEDEDIINMARIIDVWATGEWLYRNYKDFFKKHTIQGLDATFIVVSYFKTLEITLAKKIGELSNGINMIQYDRNTKKVKLVFAYDKPVKIGISDRYYKLTLGSYYDFIRNYKSDLDGYVDEKDPIHPKYQNKRFNLSKQCANFTNNHRNKCSHKNNLSASQVEKVREDFNKLMKDLLKSFRN